VGATHPSLELVGRGSASAASRPQTCEAGSFTLAGWLEPSADIAGDTFGFSLARDILHLSLTDAMGHGVAAALAATLCVGGLRNARNAGASLLEEVTWTNQLW
jgi:Stage II sporulation protein E (SpoIIE)